MADKHLRKQSHHISDDVWWYEEPEGISIVLNCPDCGKALITAITWKAIRSSLKRKDKK